jgi:hypothetical protein
MKSDVSVGIGLGNKVDLAITLGDDLIIRQEYGPGLSHRINLGRCTKQNIDSIKANLDRLRIHARDA